MNEDYYEGMFGSLKHNILLMLNQIDGNLEHTKVNPIKDLEFIESRIKDIKSKCQKESFSAPKEKK